MTEPLPDPYVEIFETDALYYMPRRAPKTGGAVRGAVRSDTPSGASLNRLIFFLNNCNPCLRFMQTITFPDQAEPLNPEIVKPLLKKVCRRFRDAGALYLWVREYTKRERVHFHIFTNQGPRGGYSKKGLHLGETRRFAKWWSNQVCQAWGLQGWRGPDGETLVQWMMQANDGKTCQPFERMRGPAAGRYCAKEGAKRFQKKAPPGWEGFAWWDRSRGFTCEPIETREMGMSDLDGAQTITILIGENRARTVLLKHQWGRGQKSL